MTTSRFAVIGNPIVQSRSPQIHHAFAKQLNIDLEYTKALAELSDFTDTVNVFFEQCGKGLNVTAPFKELAFTMAQDHLSERAALAQAVNTLWQEHGVLHGCNTDGVGLLADLTRLNVCLSQKRVLILGAGGAVRGILKPFLDQGCAHLRIANRTLDKAQLLIKEFANHCPNNTQFDASTLAECGAEWDVIINGTASGLSQEAPAIPAHAFAQNSFAYDMVYQARPTAFMEQAMAYGASYCSDGLGMLVEQAAESFYIWHGVRPVTLPVLETLRLQIIQEV